MRAMGVTQTSVLESLRKHKYWHAGCGWVWTTPRSTQRVMESLVKRGVARIDEDVTIAGRRCYLPVDLNEATARRIIDRSSSLLEVDEEEDARTVKALVGILEKGK